MSQYGVLYISFYVFYFYCVRHEQPVSNRLLMVHQYGENITAVNVLTLELAIGGAAIADA